MKEHLNEEDVTRVLDETEEEIVRICKRYRMGLETEAAFLSRVEESIFRIPDEFLPLHGLKVQFSAAGWPGFCEAYDLWKKEGKSGEGKGEAWLFSDNLEGSAASLEITRRARIYGTVDPEQYIPAPSQDVIQFFRILDRFGIPPAYFRPLPEGVLLPRMHLVHLYSKGSIYIIDYPCTEDGGLGAEKEPVQKTFCLKNELGLKANVTVKACRSSCEMAHGGMDIDDYLPTAKYLAVGTVEGYTSDRKREMTLRTDRNGKINRLGLMLKEDDDRARADFPLWQDGYRVSQEHHENQRRIVRDVCLSCIHRLDKTVPL